MDLINAIIETPKGNNVKYDYEPESGFFFLKKMLPAGMVFPYDFGFIPATKGEDGDPLDVIVISEFTTFPGCKIECRLIGSIRARQQETKDKKKRIRNDRFIAIPTHSVTFNKIDSIKDIPEKLMIELENFFIQYNKMENKIFTIQGLFNAQKSWKLIQQAQQAVAF